MSGRVIASLDPISGPVIEAEFQAASARRFESNAERIWSHQEDDSTTKTWLVRILFGFTIVPYLIALFVDIGRYMLFKRGYIDGKSWSLIEEAEAGCQAVAHKVSALGNEFMLKKHAQDLVKLYRVSPLPQGQIDAMHKTLAQDVVRYAELNGKAIDDFTTYLGIGKKLVQEAIESMKDEDELFGRQPLIAHVWGKLAPHLPKGEVDPVSELAAEIAPKVVRIDDDLAKSLDLVRKIRELKASGRLAPQDETKFFAEAINAIPQVAEEVPDPKSLEEQIDVLNFLAQKQKKIREHIDSFYEQFQAGADHDRLETALDKVAMHCCSFKSLMHLYGEYMKTKTEAIQKMSRQEKQTLVMHTQTILDEDLSNLVKECKKLGIDYAKLKSDLELQPQEDPVQILLKMVNDELDKHHEIANSEEASPPPAKSEGYLAKAWKNVPPVPAFFTS